MASTVQTDVSFTVMSDSARVSATPSDVTNCKLKLISV